MQIPLFGTQFCNFEDKGTVWKQKKIILDLLFQFIRV